MNKHILVGVRVDDTVHKVILDGVGYPEIKKRYNEIQHSEEFSKVEIWSRANGLEKSKRMKPKPEEEEKIPEDPLSPNPDETEKEEGGGDDDPDPDTPIPDEETPDDESEDELPEESEGDDFDNGIKTPLIFSGNVRF